MARRLNKHETAAIATLWDAVDHLKRSGRNGVAQTAIQTAIEQIQSKDAPDLTNTQYDALPVGAKPLRDPKRRGLIMRHGSVRGRYWLYRTECPDSRKQVEIDLGNYPALSISEARAIWAQLDERRKAALPFSSDGTKLTLGQMITTAKDEGALTVAWLCSKYMTDYAQALNVDGLPVKRSWHQDELLIDKYILPEFGDMLLTEFTAPVIDGLLDSLAHVPRQQQKIYALLCVMNNVARRKPAKRAKIRIARAWVPDDLANPMPDVVPPVMHTPKRYASSDDEITTYAANLPKLGPLWSDVLMLQLLTLARINEVAELPWSEIDLDAGTWTLAANRSKNGHAHTVYLPEQAQDILKRRRAADMDGEWVFPSSRYPETHISKHSPPEAIRDNREALGVGDGFTSHATRRRALTWMKSNGIGKEIRDAASNHFVSGTVDAVYTETASMERLTRNAVQAWADFVTAKENGNVVALSRA